MRTSIRLVSFACSILWLAALVATGCKDDAPRDPVGSASSPAPSAAPSGVAAARDSAAPSATELAPAPPNARPFLWVVTDKSLVSYLFGTVHMGQDADRLPPVVYEKLDEASTFMMETDATSLAPQAMMKYASLPDDQSLDALLGAELWQKLTRETGSMMSPELLKRFKPWFAMVLLTQSLLPKTLPMDQALEARAKEKQKEMAYLEAIDEQLALLDQVMTLDIVKDGIRDIAKTRSLLGRAQSAYAEGRAEVLEQALFDPDEMKKHPQLFEKLFFVRNRAWVRKLEKQLNEKATFVAVGAGHLLGSQGLVALLAREGLAVERIDAAADVRRALPAP